MIANAKRQMRRWEMRNGDIDYCMACHVMSCHVILYQVISCHIMLNGSEKDWIKNSGKNGLHAGGGVLVRLPCDIDGLKRGLA